MKKYGVILADPPWCYRDQSQAGKRGAVHKYDIMNNEDIMALNVKSIAARDCALFLWTTMPMLPVALDTMEAWGFAYKTVAFTWIKRTKNGLLSWGMGSWTRANPELVLLGIRGKPKVVSHGVHSVVEAQSLGHSAKPQEVRVRIAALLGKALRVELFARKKVPGWDVIGNEIDGTDILEVLR